VSIDAIAALLPWGLNWQHQAKASGKILAEIKILSTVRKQRREVPDAELAMKEAIAYFKMLFSIRMRRINVQTYEKKLSSFSHNAQKRWN